MRLSKLFTFCLLALVSSQTGWMFHHSIPTTPVTQMVYEQRESPAAMLLEVAPAAAAEEAPAVKQQSSRPTASPPSVDVKVGYRYYTISGNSAAALRSQMNRQGPIDALEQRRYDAKTDWLVQWSYRYSRQGSQCAIGRLTTQVDVTITYPQWSAPASASSALQAEWQRYMAALQLHENGHKDNGIAAGRTIMQALANLPTYPSCQALDVAASAAAQTAVRRYNQNDLDYDHTTAHGATQGAVFPGSTIALQ